MLHVSASLQNTNNVRYDETIRAVEESIVRMRTELNLTKPATLCRNSSTKDHPKSAFDGWVVNLPLMDG